jgi:hypothetical protein
VPILLIVVIAIIVLGGATAVTIPLLVGDPIAPDPSPPVEVHGPAEPGAINDAIKRNASGEETWVDPYSLYPVVADEDAGFFDEEVDRVETKEPVRDVPANNSRGGAVNSLPDF